MIPRGSAPSNEYNNPTLLFGLYPTLFPYGTGAFEEFSRPVKTSFKKQVQYLLSYHDRRFEEHHSFIFIVFNMLQRREACLHTRLMTSKPFFSKTANDIVSLDAKDIKQVLSNLRRTKPVYKVIIDKFMHYRVKSKPLEEKLWVRHTLDLHYIIRSML